MTDSAAVTIAAITSISAMIGTVVTSIFAAHAKKHAKGANDAVNNKHPDHPKLFDVVLEGRDRAIRTEDAVNELVDWRRSYNKSPWRDGRGVHEWLDTHDEQHERIERQLKDLSEGAGCKSCPKCGDEDHSD